MAVCSPVLGAIADFTKSKKRFLLLFTSISIVSTALLFFVGEGDVFMGMFFSSSPRSVTAWHRSFLTAADRRGNPGDNWICLRERLGGRHARRYYSACFRSRAIQIIETMPSAIRPDHGRVLSSVFDPVLRWVREKPGQSRTGSGIVGRVRKRQALSATPSSTRNYQYMIAYLIYNDGIMMLMDFAPSSGLRCLA